jgi:hypothetical protein
LSISITLVALSRGLALSEPGSAERIESLLSHVPHSTFEWVAAEGVSPRAAMRVPVNLDGTGGWFQMDTGLDVTLVYGDLPIERGWETHDGMYHVPGFEIGNMDLGPTWLRSRPGTDGSGELIGSLGLDILIGYLVLIDYSGRRLALMKPGEAPLWLIQHTTWTPAKLRDAKFFITLILGEETLDDLFFDTGASAFDITVDFETWKALTGCAGPEAATTRWTVNSWGSPVTAVGATARGPLVIGSARISDPQVFYLEEQPRLFAEWPFQASGLVGNAPFWDRVVVMDLGIRPRFGLVEQQRP